MDALERFIGDVGTGFVFWVNVLAIVIIGAQTLEHNLQHLRTQITALIVADVLAIAWLSGALRDVFTAPPIIGPTDPWGGFRFLADVLAAGAASLAALAIVFAGIDAYHTGGASHRLHRRVVTLAIGLSLMTAAVAIVQWILGYSA